MLMAVRVLLDFFHFVVSCLVYIYLQVGAIQHRAQVKESQSGEKKS